MLFADAEISATLAAVLAGAASLATVVAGFLIKFFSDKRKGLLDDDRQQGDQAFLVYKDIVVQLREQIKQIADRLESVVASEIACREKAAAQAVRIDQMEAEIQRLKMEIGYRSPRSQMILDNLTDAIISTDAVGTIITWNYAASRLLGWLPDEIVGKNVSILMPDEIAGAHAGYLDAYRRTGKSNIIGVGRVVNARRKNNSLVEVELSISDAKLYGSGEHVLTGVLREVRK